jgi:stage II sporulation protein P
MFRPWETAKPKNEVTPMNKRKINLITIVLLVLVFAVSTCCLAHEEMPKGQFFTMIDENSNIIHQTGTKVNVGDEYISADNARYKVVEITGNIAVCKYQGEEQMPVISFNSSTKSWAFKDAATEVVSGNKKPTIAVYHTHSDESYIPGDGKESKPGNGGIYDVGEAFVSELRKLGFNVKYNKNNHNPHDVNAYSRSRRTAMSLIKSENPDVIIDIHRDAVPPDVYETEVEGKEATKVKLVVGKQNPNMKTNLEFAKQIKAIMDKTNPGLSNGIFIGKGDYNQDLSPRAILIEVGSHTNSKQEAEAGAKLFASSMQNVLGGGDGQSPEAKPLENDNQGAYTTLAIILVVAAIGVGGFYLLNKGSGTR